MVVYFGYALKLYDPFVTLRNLCHQFNFHSCKNCSFSFLSRFTKKFNNVRYMQTSQVKLNKSTPELVYVPQVLRWLKTKFKLKVLKQTWDSEFSEGAFIYGTTRAICKISDIIHKNQPEELTGLLTDTAKNKLVTDMNTKLTRMQKKIIKMKPEDIKILVPTQVKLNRKGALKTCEISLRSLALKWFEDRGNAKLAIVALQTEFTRDYSEGIEPEWIISIYDILECALLSETPSVN